LDFDVLILVGSAVTVLCLPDELKRKQFCFFPHSGFMCFLPMITLKMLFTLPNVITWPV